MVSTADRDLSGPNAPLLAPADASPNHGANGDIVTSELSGWFIWILTFSAGISGLLFGYEYASILSPIYVSMEANEPHSTGVISSTLVTVGSDLSSRPLTTLDESIITSSTSLFALVASPFTGVLADKCGRRRVILAADALFAAGALVQALTSQIWGMVAGRSIVGLAIGCASAVTPL